MTPEQQALREAVKLAMYQATGFSSDVATDAAISVALETAAMVAEAHDKAIMSTTAADVRANEIAAAIRALMPPSPSS